MWRKICINFYSIILRLICEILFKLNKIEINGENYLIDLIKSREPIMICVWHSRLIFPSWYLRMKLKNIYAVASHHFDAEIMSQILKKWGYNLIRGSTNKGGKLVKNEMEKIFNNSGLVAITNDGPKGPNQIAKRGSISIALKCKANIITITGSASKYWEFNTWDKFMLPKPFGKIDIVISSVINSSKDYNDIDAQVDYVSTLLSEYQDKADILSGKKYIEKI